MSEHITYLNDSNFKEGISTGVSLVDFYADWCGPCRTIAPIVEELAQEMNGTAKVVKVDIDSSQEVASNLGITSIPTIIVFKDGKEVDRVMGVRGKDTLKSMIQSAL